MCSRIWNRALRAAHAAEVEAEHGKPVLREHMIQAIHDFIVHRAAVNRVRVKHQHHRRAFLVAMVIAAFEPAFRSVYNNFRHSFPCY